MIDTSIKLLQTEADPDELVTVAVALARGPQPEGHQALTKQFQAPEFYERLDDRQAYGDYGLPLRLEQVINGLARNSAPSAHAVLVALTQSSMYKAVTRRITILIEACAVIRPAPPEVVRFWDAHCRPDDGFTPVTIMALVENGSPPALELLERKMADPSHESEYKVGWMHELMLEHRNEVPLLESCLRMLKGPMPDELKPILVGTIFDYRPKEWYLAGISPVPTPPPPSEVGKDAHVQMRKIAEYAVKNVELSEEQKATVESYLEATAPAGP